MEPSAYLPPLDRLLSFEPEPRFNDDWADYRQLGIGPEHLPDLIRMVRDRALLDDRSDSRAWAAPIHAWRALAQMGGDAAAPAVGPLLETLNDLSEADDNDWGTEELPFVFARIGPAAIGAIDAFLAEPSRDLYAHAAAARGLAKIVERFPEARDRAVAALMAALGRHRDQDPTLNGFLTSYLLELKAVEAAPLFREAFKLETITESIAGGWRDVRNELGLAPTPDDPPDRPMKPDPLMARMRQALGLDFPPPPPPLPGRRKALPAVHTVSADVQAQRKQEKEREKAQARRKQERKARRQNRKR